MGKESGRVEEDANGEGIDAMVVKTGKVQHLEHIALCSALSTCYLNG